MLVKEKISKEAEKEKKKKIKEQGGKWDGEEGETVFNSWGRRVKGGDFSVLKREGKMKGEDGD